MTSGTNVIDDAVSEHCTCRRQRKVTNEGNTTDEVGAKP